MTQQVKDIHLQSPDLHDGDPTLASSPLTSTCAHGKHNQNTIKQMQILQKDTRKTSLGEKTQLSGWDHALVLQSQDAPCELSQASAGLCTNIHIPETAKSQSQDKFLPVLPESLGTCGSSQHFSADPPHSTPSSQGRGFHFPSPNLIPV